jgi:hypothetical protein
MAKAPNTEELINPHTGLVKDICLVLMADVLPMNEAVVAHCYLKMEELGIKPYLRRGGSFSLGDGCHEFPPTPSVRKQGLSWKAKNVTEAVASASIIARGALECSLTCPKIRKPGYGSPPPRWFTQLTPLPSLRQCASNHQSFSRSTRIFKI